MVTLMRSGILVVACFLSGCVSFHKEVAEDQAQIEQMFQSRLGVKHHIPTAAEDDGALAAEVCPLLEGGLTEEKAIKIAFLNNRGIRTEFEMLGIARADLVQAGLLTNPVFDANAKFFRSGTEIELGIAQSFLDLFYRPLRQKVAEAELLATKADVAHRVIGVIYELRRAFVVLRAAEQLVEMRQQVVEATKASYELMVELHRAGNVTDPQLTAEEVAFSRAKIDLSAAQIASYEAREPLNTLLGLWDQEITWQIEGKLDEQAGTEIALESLETKAVSSSLDLAQNRAQIDAAAQRAGIRSWEGWFETGELKLVAKRDALDDAWGVGPGLSLSLPFFNQGQTQIATAQAQLRQSLNRYVELSVEVRSAARTFRERFIALNSRADYLRKVFLPLRARLVRETLQNYNAMQIGVFDVLLAKQQEIEAGQEYIETLKDLSLARLDLEELLAGSLNRSRMKSSPSPSGHERNDFQKKGH